MKLGATMDVVDVLQMAGAGDPEALKVFIWATVYNTG